MQVSYHGRASAPQASDVDSASSTLERSIARDASRYRSIPEGDQIRHFERGLHLRDRNRIGQCWHRLVSIQNQTAKPTRHLFKSDVQTGPGEIRFTVVISLESLLLLLLLLLIKLLKTKPKRLLLE